MAVAAKHRLSQEMVNNPLKNGYYCDGEYLYLRVKGTGATRTWCIRYPSPTKDGKLREYSIGSTEYFSLIEARAKAEKLRSIIAKGIDPADLRKPKPPTEREAPYLVTFEDAARDFVDLKKPEWKGDKQEKIWINSLEQHVFPYIGSLPVNEIDDEDVLKVLKPIWNEITETASRIRNRMENVFDYARGRKWTSKENPARWRGVLEYRLANPRPILARKKRHFYALKDYKIPALFEALGKGNGTSFLMVKFLIATVGRSIEIREADWSEINLKQKLWTIPKERMKGAREHVVPLCNSAINVLNQVYELSNGRGLVFRNTKGESLTDVALSKALKKASGDRKATIHGLRSTFCDWASETKAGSFHAIQLALAHQMHSASDAAYFRSTLLEERRVLMNRWEKFFLGKTEKQRYD